MLLAPTRHAVIDFDSPFATRSHWFSKVKRNFRLSDGVFEFTFIDMAVHGVIVVRTSAVYIKWPIGTDLIHLGGGVLQIGWDECQRRDRRITQ